MLNKGATLSIYGGMLCSVKDVLLTIKAAKTIKILADGNLICEDHAKLTPWQKEELIEKDANQVNEYIDNLTNKYLTGTWS